MIGGEDGGGIWGMCDPGEPRNRRMRSSILVEGAGGEAFLVDSGPDLREQLLGNRIGRFEAVLYTHPHSDHTAGLDELRAINRVIDAPLPLFATLETLEELEARFAYAFHPWSGTEFFRPVFSPVVVVPGETYVIAGCEVALHRQRHGRIETLGVRCGSFAYCTDVEFLPDESLKALRGIDTWMVDCFQREPHSAHAWLERVMEWREILRPRRTILTHLGPDMDYARQNAALPDGVEMAFDGMEIVLPE